MAPEDTEDARREAHVHEFGRPGARPMRGFVRVEGEALGDDDELAGWVDAAASHAASLPPK
jgi:hypothetical protein